MSKAKAQGKNKNARNPYKAKLKSILAQRKRLQLHQTGDLGRTIGDI